MFLKSTFEWQLTIIRTLKFIDISMISLDLVNYLTEWTEYPPRVTSRTFLTSSSTGLQGKEFLQPCEDLPAVPPHLASLTGHGEAVMIKYWSDWTALIVI